VREPHNAEATDLTFAQLADGVRVVGAGMTASGLQPGEVMGVIGEGSSRWLLADQGAMWAGAATAVRGAAAPAEELAYIIRHARCAALVVDDVAVLRKLAPVLSQVRESELRVFCVTCVMWLCHGGREW
jgi:long-chain acyl-CoA synthetase